MEEPTVSKTEALQELEKHQKLVDEANAEFEAKKDKTLRETLENLGSNMETMENKKMSRQEENWMLMTTLQIPWKDANAIEDPKDRKFLLEKVKEVQKYMMQEQEQMQQRQQEIMEKQQQPPQSPIITPQQMGL